MKKKTSRSRSWTYTLNNYNSKEEEKVQALDASYHLYGRETGENGTPHLQGYLYFKNKKSLKQLKKLIPRAHLEIARGTAKQNIDYCSKDGDTFAKGTPPKGATGTATRAEKNAKLRESNLEDLVANGDISILTVPVLAKARRTLSLLKPPIQRLTTCGVWIHGPPGTGKTHYARHSFGDSVFMKSQSKWFDGYQNEDVIVLDDLDTNVLGHYLKIWTDKWPCYGEIKGGTIGLRHTLFVVTSNYTPNILWSEDVAMAAAVSRRCIFKHMK